jgi:hypothetical protein
VAVANDPIKITGLRELQASLKKMDGQSQKQLRNVLNESAEMVATGAQGLVTRRSGRAAGSIKVASSQREARVKAGGARVPYYGFLDYGGAVGRNRSVKRPFIKGGRYIYPTYDAKRGAIETKIQESIVKLVQDSGLEVS